LKGMNFDVGVEVVESPPNLAKMPRFFGLPSSSLISSKPSSFAEISSIFVGGDSLLSLSKLGRGERPSNCNEGREAPITGERAEMSNDRRYPSHDSRGIVNGSSIEVRSIGESDFPPFLFPQKLFFSVGEGGKYTPLSLTTLNLYSPVYSSSLPRIIDTAFDSVLFELSMPVELSVEIESDEYGLPRLDPVLFSLEPIKYTEWPAVEVEVNESVDPVTRNVGVT